MTITALKDKISGELSTRDKRRLNRMREKVKLLTGELEAYEGEEKKLKFKVSKLENDREVLLEKIEGKNTEIKKLSVAKYQYGERLVENDRPLKRFMAAISLKSGRLEEENTSLRRSIDEIDKKEEKISHFIEKNRKKEEKLDRELKDLTDNLDTLRERLDEVQDNLDISQRTLKEFGGVY